jgi:1-phosphatidylinositol-4-phosphate 5-kinase
MSEVKATLNPMEEKTIEAIRKSGEGMGRSGSFFFFSSDKKLLVKSMKQDDVDAWKKSFKQYTLHVINNKESLLARIYGVYSI